MDNIQISKAELDRYAAVKAAPLLLETIVIKTDADLTPIGKRGAKVVTTTKSGRKCNQRIRWYVGGKIFREFSSPTQVDVDLTNKWLQCQ